MRKVQIAPGEYYHIYNRGNNKQTIFLDERDQARFLFLILYLQSPVGFRNIGRNVTNFVQSRAFNIERDEVDEIVKNRYVELVNFCLMPNHFHSTLLETKEKGIARYMHRVLTAYTKYFNTKYEKSGHLFQGPYQAVHITNDAQLTHLSAYIHRNPREIKEWKNKEDRYEWSSFQDYSNKNRWGKLLKHQIVTEQTEYGKNYKKFIATSMAKLTLDEKLILEEMCKAEL